jgi:hypothetical protein
MSGISARLRRLPGRSDPGTARLASFFNAGRELSGGVRTSFHRSGKSSGHCRSRHIRRTTSSPSFPLALEGNGSMDIARPGPAGLCRTTTGDSGVEDSGVVPRARAELDSATAVRKRRKSWTGGLPLLHSDRSRQLKVDPRRSPRCNRCVRNYIAAPAVLPQSKCSPSRVLRMCVSEACAAKVL